VILRKLIPLFAVLLSKLFFLISAGTNRASRFVS